MAVSFLTQPSLQLEKRTAGQRLKMVRAQGGDMRVQMGFQILVSRLFLALILSKRKQGKKKDNRLTNRLSTVRVDPTDNVERDR